MLMELCTQTPYLPSHKINYLKKSVQQILLWLVLKLWQLVACQNFVFNYPVSKLQVSHLMNEVAEMLLE